MDRHAHPRGPGASALRSTNESTTTILQRTLALTPPRLVTVSGCTQSGKTTLSRDLASLLVLATVVEMDWYFRDADDPLLPRDERGRPSYDRPDAFHTDAFRTAVVTLLAGSTVLTPVYDIATNRRMDWVRFLEPAPTVIAEGLFALRALARCWPRTLHVYVRADLTVRTARRSARDAPRYGLTPERVAAHVRERIVPDELRWICPQERDADLIIDTTHTEEEHA